jgi:hypothetical protein
MVYAGETWYLPLIMLFLVEPEQKSFHEPAGEHFAGLKRDF